jgi:predicted O-methyltransferase YrrM
MTPSAADVRAARYALYEAGVAPDMDGGTVPVLPHALPRADSDGIAALVVREQARRTLEVGIGIGVGTLAVCEALLELGVEGGHVVVDPFDFGNDVAVRTLRDAGVEPMVTRLREPSQTALPRMVAEGDRFDLLLVDGGHRFDEVFLDLIHADALVRPGGVVVTDDLWPPTATAALRCRASSGRGGWPCCASRSGRASAPGTTSRASAGDPPGRPRSRGQGGGGAGGDDRDGPLRRRAGGRRGLGGVRRLRRAR